MVRRLAWPGVTSEKYFDGNFTIINGKVKDQKILFKVKSAKDKMVYPFNFLITGKDRFYFSEDFYMDSRAQSLIMGNPKIQLTMISNIPMKVVL
jgi:hypothetical protein